MNKSFNQFADLGTFLKFRLQSIQYGSEASQSISSDMNRKKTSLKTTSEQSKYRMNKSYLIESEFSKQYQIESENLLIN